MCLQKPKPKAPARPTTEMLYDEEDSVEVYRAQVPPVGSEGVTPTQSRECPVFRGVRVVAVAIVSAAIVPCCCPPPPAGLRLLDAQLPPPSAVG